LESHIEDLAEGGRRLPYAIVPSDRLYSNSEVVAPIDVVRRRAGNTATRVAAQPNGDVVVAVSAQDADGVRKTMTPDPAVTKCLARRER
jgi:hypothetical protein